MSFRRRFELALEAGFEGVDAETTTDEAEIASIKEASAATGIVIPSVVDAGSRRYQLSSDDPREVESAVGSLLTTLGNARVWGAGAIHLIPSHLRRGVPFPEAYRRTQQVLREQVLPVAEDYGVVCGVENAWYTIVQGPFEYVRFIDEMDSPCLKAFLDIGNVAFGHAEDWVRLAGDRIVRLHIKDFRLEHAGRFAWRKRGWFSFGRIGEGAIDWKAVSAALLDVGYAGWGTTAGIAPALPERVFNKLCAVLSRHRAGRLPGLGWSLSRLQGSLTLRSLRSEARRLARFLQ